MNELAKALYDFWNSFGIFAYQLDKIPDNAKYPYLTYKFQQGQTFGELPDSISIFYKGRNKQALFAKAEEISEKIGQFAIIPFIGGNIAITKINWEELPDSDNTVALYGSFSIQYNL